jgi:hypothetical protein
MSRRVVAMASSPRQHFENPLQRRGIDIAVDTNSSPAPQLDAAGDVVRVLPRVLRHIEGRRSRPASAVRTRMLRNPPRRETLPGIP